MGRFLLRRYLVAAVLAAIAVVILMVAGASRVLAPPPAPLFNGVPIGQATPSSGPVYAIPL